MLLSFSSTQFSHLGKGIILQTRTVMATQTDITGSDCEQLLFICAVPIDDAGK